jgi:DNA-binding response OmpR family regulator
LSPRVLIVEDDPATRHLLGALLEHESIEWEAADGGEAALQKIAERDFDAVLLDLLMPRVNGFDVLRDLAVHRTELMRRVIVMTAATDSAWRECEDVQRVRCVLRKPLDITQVVGHVRACLAAGALVATRRTAELPASERRKLRRAAFANTGKLGEGEMP